MFGHSIRNDIFLVLFVLASISSSLPQQASKGEEPLIEDLAVNEDASDDPMTQLEVSGWGQLENPNYIDFGTVQSFNEMDFYIVGNSSKCIIWNYDIGGFDSGRSRQLCDLIAQHGYTVIIPDYYRGKTGFSAIRQFIQKQTDWDKMKIDIEQRIFPYAEENGCTVYGAIGTCWGSYPVMRLSSYPKVKAGVSMHPSHQNIVKGVGETEEELYNEISSQQLFLPSQNEGSTVQKGGLAEQILGDKLTIIPFPDMRHGWTTRGDMSDPKVNRDVRKAMNDAIMFFGQHVKN